MVGSIISLQISMNVRLQEHVTPMPHVATLRDHTIVPVCMVTLEMDSTAQVNCTCVLVFIGSHFRNFQELTCVMLDPLTVTLMQPALTEMEAMTVNAMMATLGMEHTVKVL